MQYCNNSNSTEKEAQVRLEMRARKLSWCGAPLSLSNISCSCRKRPTHSLSHTNSNTLPTLQSKSRLFGRVSRTEHTQNRTTTTTTTIIPPPLPILHVRPWTLHLWPHFCGGGTKSTTLVAGKTLFSTHSALLMLSSPPSLSLAPPPSPPFHAFSHSSLCFFCRLRFLHLFSLFLLYYVLLCCYVYCLF